jgi:hypothetical protein
MGGIEQKKYLQKRYIIEVKLNIKRCKIPFNPVKRRKTLFIFGVDKLKIFSESG